MDKLKESPGSDLPSLSLITQIISLTLSMEAFKISITYSNAIDEVVFVSGSNLKSDLDPTADRPRMAI